MDVPTFPYIVRPLSERTITNDIFHIKLLPGSYGQYVQSRCHYPFYIKEDFTMFCFGTISESLNHIDCRAKLDDGHLH